MAVEEKREILSGDLLTLEVKDMMHFNSKSIVAVTLTTHMSLS